MFKPFTSSSTGAAVVVGSSTTNHHHTPVVTHDPRFQAGRTLVERGMAHQGAVDIFATLLEETIAKFGDSSIECAPAFYEYGNALLRAAGILLQQEEQDDRNGNEEFPDTSTRQEMAARAAEHRQQLQQQPPNLTETISENCEEHKKPTPMIVSMEEGDEKDGEEATRAAEQRQHLQQQPPTFSEKLIENGQEHQKPAAIIVSMEEGDEKDEEEEENDDEDSNDDTALALTMMETAYSILDDFQERCTSAEVTQPHYAFWVHEQLPRVLLGIGDALSALKRHADSADAYSRSLELRQTMLKAFNKEDVTIAHLSAHCKVVEANILIAEELLACPPGQDVMTTETSSLIVKKEERVSYAKGYYDKARDALQDAVFFMGQLAARNVENLEREKENVCFMATLVMGVGESLAAIEVEEDEQKQLAADMATCEPVRKKSKRS